MINSEKLTSRELVILELLKKGFSNENISGKTGITINTVKFHLKKIYKKLDTVNRVQAINKYNDILNQKTKLT